MEIGRKTVEGAVRIVRWPDPVLRRACGEISPFGPESAVHASDLAARMFAMMRALAGLGLAAPQVGVPARMFVWDAAGSAGAVVNPVLCGREGASAMEEGCLSLPGIIAEIERNESAVLVGLAVNGEPLRIEGSGLVARVWQHEIDHLDGITLVERMTDAGRLANSSRLERLRTDAGRRRRTRNRFASDPGGGKL